MIYCHFINLILFFFPRLWLFFFSSFLSCACALSFYLSLSVIWLPYFVSLPAIFVLHSVLCFLNLRRRSQYLFLCFCSTQFIFILISCMIYLSLSATKEKRPRARERERERGLHSREKKWSECIICRFHSVQPMSLLSSPLYQWP